MKVLVTGSTGFIGAALCNALVKRGDQVIAFHRQGSNLRLLEGLPVEHRIGDLTQPATLYDAMEGIEVVFHTAAQLGNTTQPGRMYVVTVEGTRALMRACRQANVRRVVHTSSVAALGIPEPIHSPEANPPLLDESHTWNYRPDYWPYGYAKYLAEMEVQQAIALGLDVVIVNPTAVFGPGDIYRQNSSLIVQIACHQLPAMGEGGLNVVHLDDVVAGHLAALERGQCGERYILGGQNMTHIALIRKIAQLAGVAPPASILPTSLLKWVASTGKLVHPFLHLPVNPVELHLAGLYFYYDIRKAQVNLHLDQPLPIDDALQSALDWFKATGAINLS